MSSYDQLDDKLFEMIETVQSIEKEIENGTIVLNQAESEEVSNKIVEIKDLLTSVDDALVFYSEEDEVVEITEEEI